MAGSQQYAIRGGIPGRERLRILARVMQASTNAFLDRLDVRNGFMCLDVGCGGGDVTTELARRAAPRGKAVGLDIDDTKVQLARQECKQHGVQNVEFRTLDIRTEHAGSEFDLVYARFLLTHLDNPAQTVAAFCDHLRPGGLVAVEDIDFSGSFAYPDCPAFRRYLELYCGVVRRRGGDPNIGGRLPILLAEAGFENVDLTVVQPMGLQGEVKRINVLTLENIAGAILEDDAATRQEIDALVHELSEFAANPRTLAGLPRIVQAWGRRPIE